MENIAYEKNEKNGNAKETSDAIHGEEIERKSINVSYPLLQELGGWPVLGDLEGGGYSDDSFNLTTLLRALRKYNNNPLIDIYVSSDVKDSENNIIYLDQPSFGLPGRLYYLDSNLAHMRDAYIKLARGITMPSEDRRDNEALYNKMTIQQLTQNFTEPSPKDNIQFGWLEYMQGIMSLEGVDIELNSSEPVVVVYGQATKRARWRTCEDYVTGQMGMAIGHMFVRETFDESAKSIALDMIGNIRNAFNELLDELDWMDPSTKELAREKVTVSRTEHFQNVLGGLNRASTGRQYDKDGNLVQWWSDTIINNFKEKAKCIVDQYGDFLVREANLTINGINTQGENIADNGGLKQSFRIWCNNMRRESVINAINTGVHSPGEFRVIGTLQNSPDFATAFGCKKSNVMNPEKKCYHCIHCDDNIMCVFELLILLRYFLLHLPMDNLINAA
ncbi:NEP4-like protein [Mya arenaria]|uniref:NEP4-like protein n=1 Tax=Mya arenaria TaxID=6604 RepID=A0ABY7EY12_MYAAR|nr:NEP4-like protein [Mya arenaria]